MRMVLLALAALTTVSAQSSSLEPRPYFTEPAISPDRSEIAFVSGGDIWAMPAAGGEARLLLSHPANEARPIYSPDGRRLAFVSNRTGGGDIYLLTLATGAVTRLTYDDGNEQLDGWSRDGAWVYFSSTSHDIAGMNDVFRVSAEGGTPMEVAADRYTNEYFSSPSPDGRGGRDRPRAPTPRGNGGAMAAATSTRPKSGWRGKADTPRYEPVTSGGAKELWPLWAADGQSVFFVSDRSGRAERVAAACRHGSAAARPLTTFKSGRVLWPTISHDGRLLAFEHDFEIWTLDTTTERASRLAVTRRGAPATTAVEHLTLTEGFTELDLSPDGKKVAFVARGEVFAASAKDGGDAARISRTPEAEAGVTWSPDSRTLVYTSDRGGTGHLYLYDFAADAETRLTSGADTDHSAAFSPDGKTIAFVRGDTSFARSMSRAEQERSIARGVFDRPPFAGEPPVAWSPDNRWLAYLSAGAKMFTNVHVAGLDGAARPPGELPRQLVRQHHLVVARTARPCTSTRGSAPSSGKSRAST